VLGDLERHRQVEAICDIDSSLQVRHSNVKRGILQTL
jgi:hypothetical protein